VSKGFPCPPTLTLIGSRSDADNGLRHEIIWCIRLIVTKTHNFDGPLISRITSTLVTPRLGTRLLVLELLHLLVTLQTDDGSPAHQLVVNGLKALGRNAETPFSCWFRHTERVLKRGRRDPGANREMFPAPDASHISPPLRKYAVRSALQFLSNG